MKKNKCSFCGRDEDEVPVLLNGLNGFICSDCVKQAQIVLDEITPKNKKSKLKNFSNIKPVDIKKRLDAMALKSLRICTEKFASMRTAAKRILKTPIILSKRRPLL